MNQNDGIKYIRHSEIDEAKWNLCIDASINNRIYAYTWHLDRVAPYWDALILGDYEYIMPLPFRKKLWIKYIYQPFFSQQLGIYPAPKQDISNRFYQYLAEHFLFVEVQLNAGNLPAKKVNEVNFLSRKNYVLPLGDTYQNISSFFSKNTQRNIAKAEKNKLTVVEGIRLEHYFDLKKATLPFKVSKDHLQILKSIIAYGQYKGIGEIYGVYTAENELCAAVYFCRSNDRVIYFNAASTEEGKNLRAMHFLVNHFIEKNAGKNLTLDFEGSMIPGVARFYAGFGASPETYFQLKINRLPLPFRWFKR